MSRTYRDTRAAKRKRDMAPPDRHWAQREPSWWHQLHTHKPARRTLSAKLHNVVTEREEDDGNWPDHRKPHVYYW